MSFLSRSRYGPFIYAAVGVALIIFALVDTTVSRLVLVVGGLAIGGALATWRAHLTGARRNSSIGRP
jgi:hypothetical protein